MTLQTMRDRINKLIEEKETRIRKQKQYLKDAGSDQYTASRMLDSIQSNRQFVDELKKLLEPED